MKKELDEKICADFPSIYRDRNAPMNQTCMCWGFSCGDGWYDMLYTLSMVIDNSLKSERFSSDVPWYFRPLYWLAKKANLPWSWIASMHRSKTSRVGVILVVDQVKEKFGTLRYYYHFEDNPDVQDVDLEYTREMCNEIEGAVRMACAMSGRICEECGNPGRQRGGGWVYVRCDACCEKEGISKDSIEDDSSEA